MDTAVRSRRKIAYTVLAIVSIPVILIAALFAFATYINWSAERKAAAFCKDIEIGSEIALAVEKAKRQNVFYGTGSDYTFYFFGFVFDKAVCNASVTDGEVTSKSSEMEYD